MHVWLVWQFEAATGGTYLPIRWWGALHWLWVVAAFTAIYQLQARASTSSATISGRPLCPCRVGKSRFTSAPGAF